jgi:hypothetical protein
VVRASTGHASSRPSRSCPKAQGLRHTRSHIRSFDDDARRPREVSLDERTMCRREVEFA